MNIRLILLSTFLFSFQIVFSQYVSEEQDEIKYFEKGSELITLENFGIGLGNESIVISGGFGYGKFVLDKFCVGGSFDVNYVSQNFFNLRTGVFTRYYILQKRLTPIIEANYQIDFPTISLGSNNYNSTFNHYSSLNAGLVYLINRSYAIGLTYGYAIDTGETISTRSFVTGIILNYHFQRNSE